MDISTAEPDDLTTDWNLIKDAELEAARQFMTSIGDLTSSSNEKLIRYTDKLDHVQLNIAITGESGAGKSSFVNVLRGVGDEEEEEEEEGKSAPTGVVETTVKPTSYPLPKYPNVVLWDLPGIGTPNFKAEDYLVKVHFDSYDFFILIASERLKINVVDLAKQIHKMGKKFYFVRSKIDVNIRSEKRKRKKKFDLDLVLNVIRQDCVKGLEESGVDSPVVFLISSHDPCNYDFCHLLDSMERDLHKHKQDVFLLSLPVVAIKIQQKKRVVLQNRIPKVALMSAHKATVKIPGLSILADVDLLESEIRRYYKTFDLDDKPLENLSRQTGVPFEEFKACLRSPLTKEISADMVKKKLADLAESGVRVSGNWFKMLPFLGSVPPGELAYASTKLLLENCLKELADDSESVLMRALQTEV